MPIDDKNSSEKICEACGEKFSCGAANGQCWCFESKVRAENLIELEKDYNDCLCRKCLSGYDKKTVSTKL